MFDEPYAEAIQEWVDGYLLWKEGKHPDQEKYDKDGEYDYKDWAGEAPESKYYRPAWRKEEMTWWQVYETVSEGTPVTPPFATRQELIDYLVENGDFWDQDRRKRGDTWLMPCDPWKREVAERFVNEVGWAPTLISSGGIVKAGKDWLEEKPCHPAETR